MRLWLVRITAVEAYLGNPHDPLHWHRTVRARTADEAIAAMRRDRDIPVRAPMVAFLEGHW